MNKFKIIFLFFLAIVFFISLFYYINLYLTRTRAGASSVTFSFLSEKINLNIGQIREIQLLAQFQNGSALEKIDYLKVVLNFPQDILELVDYIDTSSSGLGRQMRVDGPQAANSGGQIVIELGAQAPGSGPTTENPLILAKIKFKGKVGGKGQLSIVNAQVVNNTSVEITQIYKKNIMIYVSQLCESDEYCGPNAFCQNSFCVCNPGYYNCDTDDNNWQNGCESTTECSDFSPPPPFSSGAATLNLKLKFQGIMQQPTNNNQRVMRVKIKLDGGLLPEPLATESAFLLTQNRNSDTDPYIWQGIVNLPSSLIAGNNYYILVKGPKHIQKRICTNSPTETSPGSYRCFSGNITLLEGVNNLDFSKVYLLAGDLPVSGGQDGVVNSLDTSYIRNNLGKTDPEVLAIADLNLDGKIDTQDWSLVIAALSVRADEE